MLLSKETPGLLKYRLVINEVATNIIMKKLRDHIDKAGIIGVIFSHLCCIGAGARIGLFAPALSGFLMNNKVLSPFLLISLAVSMFGVFSSYLRHRNIFPFLISVISSATIIVFSFIVHFEALLYIGLAGLIGASIYNMFYIKKE